MIKCLGGINHGKSSPDYGPTMVCPVPVGKRQLFFKAAALTAHRHYYNKVWRDDVPIYLYCAGMVKSRNGWSCLLASAAMAFGCDMDEILNFLGHTGSEQGQTGDRRGFHIQEIARFANWHVNANLVPVEPKFAISTPNGDYFTSSQTAYFESRIRMWPAILEGYTPRCGHACYWDGNRIMDPRGVYDPTDFIITCAWLII